MGRGVVKEKIKMEKGSVKEKRGKRSVELSRGLHEKVK